MKRKGKMIAGTKRTVRRAVQNAQYKGQYKTHSTKGSTRRTVHTRGSTNRTVQRAVQNAQYKGQYRSESAGARVDDRKYHALVKCGGLVQCLVVAPYRT
eukprot:3672352-Rhodomonas_salina.1